ncbi:lectin-like domain-containing protein [Leuconostoc citreum]
MEQEKKIRYKLFKSGKSLVTMILASTLIYLINAYQIPTIHADTASKTSSVASKEAGTTVDKDNFTDYFVQNGSSHYDQSTGINTITENKNDQVGSFSLKTKIDTSTSFVLDGQVNLGNKTQGQGGADGIGFAFHNGNTSDLGNAGGNLGIGGLQNAIGFKLDTYHNNYAIPRNNSQGAEVPNTDSNGYGWSADPDTNYSPFGAFVTTQDKQIKATDGNSYQRWWADTDFNSTQILKNNDINGQFHDFKVSYDGNSRILSIDYTETDGNILHWTKSIPENYKALSMTISASTGGSKNLQQYKINSFNFKEAATVDVKYVDTSGKQIAQGIVQYPNGPLVNGNYQTDQKSIEGYKFKEMDDGSVTGYKSLPSQGTLIKPGNNGDVIYVYEKIEVPSSETPSSEVPSSEVPSSEVPSSETPSSEVPSSEVPSSEVPSSETPSSEVPSSEVPSSETPSSETPSSEVPSSEVPSSETPSSEVPSSEVPSSETPSSEVPSSEVPSSETPSSEVPSSEVPSSEVPSSETPSSETPSSEVPSSEVPSSETPSSEVPSSEVPSSETPSSETPSSETPSSEVPSSEVPSSEVPSSETPSSEVPSSETPSSEVPSSEVPSSEVPSSETPSSEVPSSEIPSSEVPSSETPSSEVPSSETPSSEVPSSEVPSSEVPSSEVPSSESKKSGLSNHNKLPKTGVKQVDSQGAVSLIALASLGVTGIALKRRKK